MSKSVVGKATTLKDRFNFLDVVITACQGVGAFLHSNSAKDDKEHKLDKALIPEVCIYLAQYVELGRTLRSNLHKKIKNSEEDMKKASLIWRSFCNYYSTYHPDDKFAVGKFSYFYPRQVLIPIKEKEFAKEGKSIYFDNRIKQESNDDFSYVKQRYFYVFFVDADSDESRQEPFFLDDNDSYEDGKRKFLSAFKGCYSEEDVLDFSPLYERTIRVSKRLLEDH